MHHTPGDHIHYGEATSNGRTAQYDEQSALLATDPVAEVREHVVARYDERARARELTAPCVCPFSS